MANTIQITPLSSVPCVERRFRAHSSGFEDRAKRDAGSAYLLVEILSSARSCGTSMGDFRVRVLLENLQDFIRYSGITSGFVLHSKERHCLLLLHQND